MAKSTSKKSKKRGPTPKAGSQKVVEEEAPKVDGPTPLVVPVTAIGSILAGLVVIILSFLEVLPQAPQPQYNLVGLVFMCVGFVVATQIK